MTVHIDRAHHHPTVYKRDGRWWAGCPRCGLLRLGLYGPAFVFWRGALIAAFDHADRSHS